MKVATLLNPLIIFVALMCAGGESAYSAPLRLQIDASSSYMFFQPVKTSRYVCYSDGTSKRSQTRIGRISSSAIVPDGTVWNELFDRATVKAVSTSSRWKSKVPKKVQSICSAFRARVPKNPPAPAPTQPCANFTSASWETILSHLGQIAPQCIVTLGTTHPRSATEANILQLVSIAANDSRQDVKGHAVRLLGHIAELGMGEPAGELALVTLRQEIVSTLLNLIPRHDSVWLVANALWTLDSFYFPTPELRPLSIEVARNHALHPSLRFRAAGVFGRFLFQHQQHLPLSDFEHQVILEGLFDVDTHVRAQYAYIAYFLPGGAPAMSPAQRSTIVDALQQRFALEQDLVAKGYLAYALDQFNGSNLSGLMKSEFEAAHLPNTVTEYGITVRSSLPVERLHQLTALLNQTRNAYLNIVHPDLASPIAGDPNDHVNVTLFGSPQRYRDYMSLWGGCCANAGGVYFEGIATLYTYDRTASDSFFTVEHLLKHEFTHYLNGRHVHPGMFHEAGYDWMKRAWQDEGFAEVMAGVTIDAGGNYTLTPHSIHRQRACGSHPPVSSVLSGDFSSQLFYTHAWAMNYYLVTQRRSAHDSIFRSFRDGSYQRNAFSSISGIPSEEILESEIGSAIQNWCNALPSNAQVESTEFPHFERTDAFPIAARPLSPPNPESLHVYDVRSLTKE